MKGAVSKIGTALFLLPSCFQLRCFLCCPIGDFIRTFRWENRAIFGFLFAISKINANFASELRETDL